MRGGGGGNESMFEEKTWKKHIWPDFLRQIIPEPWGFNYKVSSLLISELQPLF